MVYEARVGLPHGQGALEGLEAQLCVHVVIQRPPDDLAAVQLDEHGEVRPSRADGQVRDVADARHVRRRHREVARAHVRRDGARVRRVRRRTAESTQWSAVQALLAHDPRDALVIHAQPLLAKRRRHARAPVGAAAGAGSGRFKLEVWADNWFSLSLGDTLVVEDPVSITTERSFNAVTHSFDATFPLNLNFILKDFKEEDSGLEYIGTDGQQLGTAASSPRSRTRRPRASSPSQTPRGGAP